MQKAIVFHSDILGFKEIIKKSENDINEETLTMLKSVLNESFSILKQFNAVKNSTTVNQNFKFFSDNLYTSFSYLEGDLTSFCDAFILAVFFARIYFENMLNNKILIRGGISFGNDYCDDKMIFSMALVKAYNIESQKAIYPRIVIDFELVDFIKRNLEVPTNLILEILNNSILIDQDETYFLNPTGIAKDFKQEFKGYKGAVLDMIYIKQNIKFIITELQKLKAINNENLKIKVKLEWLKILLLWNLKTNLNIKKLNSFEKLTFKNCH